MGPERVLTLGLGADMGTEKANLRPQSLVEREGVE